MVNIFSAVTELVSKPTSELVGHPRASAEPIYYQTCQFDHQIKLST